VIYLSSPTEPTYEADFMEPLHLDLKREARTLNVRKAKNETDFDKLPLFQKYQFFTPGTSLLLVSIPRGILLF
jgi:hypothetical protein